MYRTSALAVVMIAALGLAFLMGASVSTGAKPVDEKKPDAAKPGEEKKSDVAKPVGQKTAVFNMAAVMREFRLAKYHVWLLNKHRNEVSKKIAEYREDYKQIEQDIKSINAVDYKLKTARLLNLQRLIEDEDRKIDKELNEAASKFSADIYDKLKLVVDKTAEENGFQLVFAYPDAVTPQEKEMPYIKELKLKPPAAQPFYVAHDADITATVVKKLNEQYPPIDPVTKTVVDTDMLTPDPSPIGPDTPRAPLPSGRGQFMPDPAP